MAKILAHASDIGREKSRINQQRPDDPYRPLTCSFSGPAVPAGRLRDLLSQRLGRALLLLGCAAQLLLHLLVHGSSPFRKGSNCLGVHPSAYVQPTIPVSARDDAMSPCGPECVTTPGLGRDVRPGARFRTRPSSFT